MVQGVDVDVAGGVRLNGLAVNLDQVGAELMQLWHLPPVYQQVADFRMTPPAAQDDFRPAVNVVHLAHQFCQNPRAGQHDELFARCAQEIPQFSRLPENLDEILVDEIDSHTDDVLELLWPRGAQDLGNGWEVH